MKVGLFFKRLERLSIDNSPVILTAIGVAGVVGTAYLAAKNALSARDYIYKQNMELNALNQPYLTPKEEFAETFKFYIPAVATGTLTCAAIISANRIGTRRTAALAAAYTITERAFDEYREKVVERVGENKERAFRDEIAQDRVTAAGESSIILGEGKVLCYDKATDRYFQSSMDELKRAENQINHNMIQGGMYASLSDFYDLVGLKRTSMSESVGWTVDKLMRTEISGTVSPDGRPCLVLDFTPAPVRGYLRLHP